jgi:hypothetical protein
MSDTASGVRLVPLAHPYLRHGRSSRTPTPAGPLTPDRYGAATWPLVIERQRLPRKVFRRSIAWLSDWLFTLRGARSPRPTQNSLPAAVQALPDGLFTRKVPMKGFRSASYISSSLPKLSWRNRCRPQRAKRRTRWPRTSSPQTSLMPRLMTCTRSIRSGRSRTRSRAPWGEVSSYPSYLRNVDC